MSVSINITEIAYNERFIVVKGELKVAEARGYATNPVIALYCGNSPVSQVSLSNILSMNLANEGGSTLRTEFACALGSYIGLPMQKMRLTVRASDLEGQIKLSEIKLSQFVPEGDIDLSLNDGLNGWVFAPTRRRSKCKIVATFNDALELPISPDIERNDLSILDLQGTNRIGFKIPIDVLTSQLRGMDSGFRFVTGREYKLKLKVANSCVCEKNIQITADSEGRVERIAGSKLLGWAVDRPQRARPPKVELYLDGVRYITARADVNRSDLKRKGKAERWGGFEFDRLEEGPLRRTVNEIAVFSEHSAEALKSATELRIGNSSQRSRHVGMEQMALSARGNGVSIVVPVYNAPAELDACIASLLTFTTMSARLILINDASPDLRVDEVLSKWSSLTSIEVHRNEMNLGFTKTVNRGIEIAGRDDVVFLNSDTVVTPRWLENLSFAAQAGNKIGTVTAVSNNAGAFSVPENGVSNLFPDNFDAADIARILSRKGRSVHPVTPTGNGFCMYVRRTVLDQVGVLDAEAFPRGYGEENDLSMRAQRAGFTHLVDDNTFVYHKRSASFGEEKNTLYSQGRQTLERKYPEYGILVRDFSRSRAMEDMRWLCRNALKQVEPLRIPLPRCLYVIATQTGGTPQTNQDLMAALSDRFETWLLRCDSKTIYLSVFKDGVSTPVDEIPLQSEIPIATHRSGEYDVSLARLIRQHSIELVHVRHIAWHSLGLFDVCEALRVPVVMSFHDFYTVCPTVKLLDETQTYCEGVCTAGDGPCRAELWPSSSVPKLKHGFINRWKEMMAAALSKCDAFVTTSLGAKETLIKSYGFLAEREFPVIQHGRSFGEMHSLATKPGDGERLRILVPGNISAAKGAALINEISKLDDARKIELHILGDPGKLKAAENIIIHGRYQRDEFARHVAQIRPHVGVVFSIWPETYCHTLTEMWICGIPVVGFDIGAVGERLFKHGCGWLVDKSSPPAALYSLFLDIQAGMTAYETKLAATLEWQNTVGAHYSTTMMAAFYDRLYRRVIARRQPFRETERTDHLCRAEVAIISGRHTGLSILPKKGWLEHDVSVYACGIDVPIAATGFLDPAALVLSKDIFKRNDLLSWLQRLESGSYALHLDLPPGGGIDISDEATRALLQLPVRAIAFGFEDIEPFCRSPLSIGWTSRQRERALLAKDIARPLSIAAQNESTCVSIIIVNCDPNPDQVLARITDLSSSSEIVFDVCVLNCADELFDDGRLEAILPHLAHDVTLINFRKAECKFEVLREAMEFCSGRFVWFVGAEQAIPHLPNPTELKAFDIHAISLCMIERSSADLDDVDSRAFPSHSVASEIFPGVNPDLVLIKASSLYEGSRYYGATDPLKTVFRFEELRSALEQRRPRRCPTFIDAFRIVLAFLIEQDSICCLTRLPDHFRRH